MAAAVQGLAVVSEDGWAIMALVVVLYLAFQLLRRCLAGLTSGRGLPATRPRKCPQASLSSRGGRASDSLRHNMNPSVRTRRDVGGFDYMGVFLERNVIIPLLSGHGSCSHASAAWSSWKLAL